MTNYKLANIMDKEVFKGDAKNCYDNLDDKQRVNFEHESHIEVLKAMAERFKRYFDFFSIFYRRGNPLTRKLQLPNADRDVTLESLVHLGLGNGESLSVADLIKSLTGEEKANELLTSISQQEIGETIKKLNDLMIKGVKAYDKQQQKSGNGTVYETIDKKLGLPFSFSNLENEKQTLDQLNKFADALNKRINLARDIIQDEKSKKTFNEVLFNAIARNPGESATYFEFFTIPTHDAPVSLKMAQVGININNKSETYKLAQLLSVNNESSSVLGFSLKEVCEVNKEFIRSIKNSAFLVDNNRTEKKYSDIFLEKFKEICKKSDNGDKSKDDGDEYFPTAGSALELKRKRLKNVRCVLPLFEDLYSSTNSTTLANTGLVGVYSSNYKHVLSSSKKNKAASNAGFFTEDHHPLLFAYTKDSHFFVNKLFNKGDSKSTLNSFLEATNTDISFLQPRIRIYKVLEARDGKEIEIPIEFSNKIEINKSSGIYDRENAGIERVRIRRKGQTPATFDKFIDANIRFTFDSINAFTKCRSSAKGRKYSYVDLLRRPVELSPTSEQIGKLKQSVLKGFSKDKKNVDLNNFIDNVQDVVLDLYDPDKFQIKLEVGWSYNEQVFPNRSSDVIKKMEEFIKETNLVLYLTLMTHDFTFRNDGTVNLDVRYMGRAGGQLVDAFQTNIFHTPNLGRMYKALNVLDDVLSYTAKNKQDSRLDRSHLQRQKNRLVQKIQSERSDLTSQIWRRLVDAPLDKKREIESNNAALVEGNNGTYPTHILKLSMPRHFTHYDKDSLGEFGLNFEGDLDAPGTRVADAGFLVSHYRNKFLENDTNIANNLKFEVVSKIDNLKAKGSTTDRSGESHEKDLEHDPLRPEDFESQLESKDDKLGLNPQDLVKTYMSNEKNKTIDMYCIRYGSVIHSAIQNIWQFNPDGLKDIVIMIASSRFKSTSGTQIRHFNFADVPILFEDWKKFMIDKVANKKRVTYAFIDFLRDSMMELLIPAMGAMNTGCKDGTQMASPLKAVKPRLTTFSARRQAGLKPKNGRISVSLDEKLTSLLVGDNLIGNEDIIGKDPHLKHFLVMYDAGFSAPASLEKSSGSKPKLYDTNLKNNIPHIFIGANKGIMRSISFRKSSVPYLQEAKVLDRGDSDFGLLREKYDCTLETVGNPHFHQGMRFYLDPTFTGMSTHNLDVVQGVLGLGGYYDIVDVSSDISNSGFKTNIVGSWQAFHEGYDSKKRVIDPCKDK